MIYNFKLDDCEIDAVISEILCNISCFRTYGLDKNKVIDADNYLKMIEQYPDDKKLSAIAYVRNTIIPKAYNKSIQIVVNGLHTSSLQSVIIWQFLYVLAALYHYNDQMWKDIFLPRIKELAASFLHEEMQKTEKLIDAYVKRRIEIIDAAEVSEYKKEAASITPSRYRIAEGRKTDVVKVLSYMFDLKCFIDADGQMLCRQKMPFMISIGKFFDCDFSNYAQVINKAAQEDHYQDIFIDMQKKAQKKIES